MARAEKAQAQGMLAWIFQTQGQIQKSLSLLEKSLIILREEGEDWWYARTLVIIAWANLASGKIQASIELFEESLHLIEPGDLRLEIPIRNGLARASLLQNDYVAAERLSKETLELSFQLGSKRETAVCYLDLGQVALATDRLELAERNFQECVNLLSEFGDSHDLALGLVYSGKSLTARLDTEAASRIFVKVIQIGRSLNIFYLVYWGLVNLARISFLEGQPEKALEMALILQHYPVEIKVVRDDGIRLIAELQDRVSPEQVDSAVRRTEGRAIESLFDLI